MEEKDTTTEEQDKKQLVGICRTCARFPARQVLSKQAPIDKQCPVPKRENGKWNIDDFQNKVDCEMYVVGRTKEEAEEGFAKTCFLPHEPVKSCYKGCALFNEEESSCQIMIALEEFTNKCISENLLLEETARKQGLIEE